MDLPVVSDSHLDMSDDFLYQTEYIPLSTDSMLATQEKTWLTTGDDQEKDEKYDWVFD